MPRRRSTTTPSGEPPDAVAAMEVALRYLGARPRTRHELSRRLRRAGATDDVLDITLERLREIGYLDDAAFARWWSEQRDRHSPRGRRLLEAELRRHGVPGEVIGSLRDGPTEPSGFENELPATDAERARVVLERHLRGRPVPDDPKALARLGAFLMRRGFDAETVRSTIRKAGAAVDEDG